jgi:hypothetical protein
MLPNSITDSRILLSPLNWGMGHVSRCIPLIAIFLRQNNTVFFAGNTKQIAIIRSYFPDIECILHADYPFHFGSRGRFAWYLFSRFLPLWRRVRTERIAVSHYVDLHAIDLVISDHRYGFHSSKVRSIFLTHQLNLPIRWYELLVQQVHLYWMRKFDEIWVPDLDDSRLSGNLSVNFRHLNVCYIGVLSRFSLYALPRKKTNETVILVSGPKEFALSQLEDHLAMVSNENSALVVILPSDYGKVALLSPVEVFYSDDWRQCDQRMLTAKQIIARSGYSTGMDVYVLGCKAFFSPTPGQREQIYLNELWNENPEIFPRISVINHE